ncbi:high-affinity glucose transporter Hxt2p [Trichomonascus vanleenenianus]|uniref:sugar porter family MFS transporter n=1 Tax=Trichomonascus vanleenenianus TaxID=2268995 RepID=UPI003ECB0CE1
MPCALQIMLCCGLGFTLFGYDAVLYGGAIINTYFLRDFGNPDSTMLGQISATFDLGSFAGCIVTCFIGERLGRRKTIMLGCAIHIVGGVLQASSFGIPQLIVGRLVAGVGNGLITSTLSIWQSETCGALYRGKMIAAQLGILTIGAVVCAWINFGMKFVNSSFAWRFPVGLQCLFAVLCGSMASWLPESPRWLISRGRTEEGEEVVSLLLKKPVDSPEVQVMKNEIILNADHEKKLAESSTWKDLFRNDEGQNLRRITLGALTQLFQQLGGINVINYYMGYIVQKYAGFNQSQALILAAGNLMNQAFFTFVAILFIESFGRKRTMFWGYIGQGISFAVVAIGLGVGTQISRLVAVAFMFVFISVYGLSNNFVPWLYPAEINSQRYRFLGAAVSTGTNWLFNYVVVVITPVATSNIGYRYYIVYAVLNAVFAVVCYFFFVETARLSLEEIDQMFARNFRESRGKEYVTPNDIAFAAKLTPKTEHLEITEEEIV